MAELADARDSKSVVPRDVWVRSPPPASDAPGRWRLPCVVGRRYTPATATGLPGAEPGPGAVQSKEEDELELKRNGLLARRSARRRPRARRRGLRWETTAAGRRGASVVVVHGDRVRGRRRPGLHHRLRPAAAGRRRARRRCRSTTRSAPSSTSATGRPATTTSASSRATTRPPRPASGTRASARRTRNTYAENDKVIGVIGTFNSGCARDHHPGAEPGAGRRHRDDLAGEHLSVPDGQPAGRLRRHRAGQVLPDRRAELRARRPADDYQGAAVAEFMKEQGVKSVYILNDKEAYGLGVATTTRKARRVARASRSPASRPGIRRRRATRRCSRRSSRPGRTPSSSAA